MKQASSIEPEIVHLLQSLLHATRLDLSYTVELCPGSVPEVTVDFSGPDTPMLLSRNGELLQAIEHLGAKVCGLQPEEHDLLLMEAESFKARREAALVESADQAAMRVRETGEPFTFSPMTSHERRRLHLVLSASGLHTESVGAGARRAVVVYPPEKREASADPAGA